LEVYNPDKVAVSIVEMLNRSITTAADHTSSAKNPHLAQSSSYGLKRFSKSEKIL
jgi:hypothetical protein